MEFSLAMRVQRLNALRKVNHRFGPVYLLPFALSPSYVMFLIHSFNKRQESRSFNWVQTIENHMISLHEPWLAKSRPTVFNEQTQLNS